MRKILFDNDQRLKIQDLYMVEGKSTEKIAKLYEVSKETINKLLKESDISIKHSGAYKGSKTRKKLTCKDIEEEFNYYAKLHNSKLLSVTALDNKFFLKIECLEDGNIWIINRTAMKERIDRGVWCISCNKRIENLNILNELKNLAKSRGGVLLSEKYVHSQMPLEWRCCNIKHQKWMAAAYSVKRGSWCPECSDDEKLLRSRIDILDLKKIALDYEGRLLDDEYRGWVYDYLWICKFGHEFKASAVKVICEKRWCPKCSPNLLSEEICRIHLEQLFGQPFPKFEPIWLINSRGNRMELDGYCDSLKLAFEHNGVQHYKISRYCKDDETLKRRIEDDETKLRLCKENGIVLLVIPELNTKVLINNLKDFILAGCKSFGIAIPENAEKVVINYNKLRNPTAQVYLEQLIQIATERNGILLSTEYLGSDVPLSWYCNIHDNVWQATPHGIKNGAWCHVCSGLIHNKEWLKELALKNKGRCLSLEDPLFKYENGKIKIKWACDRNHKPFDMAPYYVGSGQWCHLCLIEDNRIRKQKEKLNENSN